VPKISGLGAGEILKISGLGAGEVQKVSGLGQGLIWQRKIALADSFDRADGAIGANWAFVTRGFSNSPPTVVSNAARAGTPSATSGNNATTAGFAYYVAFLNTDDMFSEIVLAATSTTVQSGMVVRMASNAATYVIGNASSSGGAIFSITGGTATTAGTAVSRATFGSGQLTSGDSFGLEAIGAVYKLYRIRSGTRTDLCTWTDTSNAVIPIGASNRIVGLALSATRNVGGTTYSANAASWRGGDS
jgi:hypothetical protein